MADNPTLGYVQPVEIVGGGGLPATISGVVQVQNVETVAPLGAGASFAGAARDCLNYESYGISVFVDPAATKAIDATVLVENSWDGVTWRQVDSVHLVGGVDQTVELNRVYATCRQFYRVSITNNDGGNAMDATEVVSMQKPI